MRVINGLRCTEENNVNKNVGADDVTSRRVRNINQRFLALRHFDTRIEVCNLYHSNCSDLLDLKNIQFARKFVQFH